MCSTLNNRHTKHNVAFGWFCYETYQINLFLNKTTAFGFLCFLCGDTTQKAKDSCFIQREINLYFLD